MALNLPADYSAAYLNIFVFIVFAISLSIVAMILPSILSKKKYNKDKLKSYECGFDPFDDARGKFDIKFYLIAMLFIIFDIEVVFLFPWAITLSKTGLFGFISMMVFLFVLTVGFIYEWRKGALEWE